MKIKLPPRIWVLIGAILLAVLFISPHPFHDGAAIVAVDSHSAASDAGMKGPTATTPPVMRERILDLNGLPVNSIADYQKALDSVQPGTMVQVRTNKNSYVLNVSANITNPQNPLGIRVTKPATTNIREGLDLTGGARVLLRPEHPVDKQTMDLVLANIQERLNVFGLSDVTVQQTSDFSGNQYVLVEVAGVNEQQIVDLLSSQGKFEAKIGNTTVFTGGNDITHVGRSATDSGIQQCNQGGTSGYICQYYFVITLSPAAAQRQADATKNLTVVPGQGGSYLSLPIRLFLDGSNVSTLQISSSLKGRAETQIQIQGSGQGPTQQDAALAAQADMKKLQTILATGSLPVKLQMVQTDTISPSLGSSFIQNIWLVGLVAIIAVVIVVTSRYHDWRISIPMIVTMLSELVIVLGVAALIAWNLDLAAIAGILVAIGTGVDDQIVIVDEVKHGGSARGTWRQRMKKAFFIIFASFFTLLAAMIPLYSAGAGLLRGFAVTTVLGVSVGVFITRPAFASIAEKVVRRED